MFSNEEKLDLLVCYIRNRRDANRAANNYLSDYPDRRQPNKRYFATLVMNLLEFGSFEKPRSKNYQTDENRDMNVCEYFQDNPTSSTRIASRDLGIGKSTIHDVLKKKHYRPYKPTIVQGLQETDYSRRVTFCNWYVGKCQDDLNFQNKLIWTDETHVTNCGIFNKHNRHYWASENPHMRERRLQVRFGFNVWCGIYGKIFYICI